jgi:rhodanese-related sulfurtransferase
MNLKEIVNNPETTIVDVRMPFEYDEEHVEGAINIPLQEIPQRVEEFKSMKQPIVVYCRSGNRSAQAQMFLRQHGIKEIYNGGGLYDMLELIGK